MAYTLGAAWILSSCNKAQTRRGERLFVAIQHQDVWRDKHEGIAGEELVVIEPDGGVRSNGPARTRRDFGAALAEEGLAMNAPIWYPIGYTPIP